MAVRSDEPVEVPAQAGAVTNALRAMDSLRATSSHGVSEFEHAV